MSEIDEHTLYKYAFFHANYSLFNQIYTSVNLLGTTKENALLLFKRSIDSILSTEEKTAYGSFKEGKLICELKCIQFSTTTAELIEAVKRADKMLKVTVCFTTKELHEI